MLIREQEGQRLVVTQPVHAWVSSQLACAWGSAEFGAFSPREEVILGALLHDIGWLDWERKPTFNPDSGLPHTFMQLPTRTHVAVWGQASRLARPFGRYASLLVSMHGTGLYGFHDYSRDTEDEADAARAFVQRELEYQQAVIDEMSKDPIVASDVSAENLGRNRRLVAVWDAMSLAICGGVSGERAIQNVPTRFEPVTIQMRASGTDITIDPWPFTMPSLDLRFEARILNCTFSDESDMRHALDSAAWTTVAVALRQP